MVYLFPSFWLEDGSFVMLRVLLLSSKNQLQGTVFDHLKRFDICWLIKRNAKD